MIKTSVQRRLKQENKEDCQATTTPRFKSLSLVLFKIEQNVRKLLISNCENQLYNNYERTKTPIVKISCNPKHYGHQMSIEVVFFSQVTV